MFTEAQRAALPHLCQHTQSAGIFAPPLRERLYRDVLIYIMLGKNISHLTVRLSGFANAHLFEDASAFPAER